MEHADQVYRVARRLVGSREEAEDRAGDLCARVPELALVHARDEPARLAAADPHQPEHRPRPAQAALAGDCSRSRKATTSSTTAGGVSPAARTDDEPSIERLSQDDVVSALSAVPHDFRDVIVLVDIGDFTMRTRRRSSTSRSGRSCPACIVVVVSSRANWPNRWSEAAMGFGRISVRSARSVMQPYLDRRLSDAEQAEAERHLDGCGGTAASAIASKPGCAWTFVTAGVFRGRCRRS